MHPSSCFTLFPSTIDSNPILKMNFSPSSFLSIASDLPMANHPFHSSTFPISLDLSLSKSNKNLQNLTNAATVLSTHLKSTLEPSTPISPTTPSLPTTSLTSTFPSHLSIPSNVFSSSSSSSSTSSHHLLDPLSLSSLKTIHLAASPASFPNSYLPSSLLPFSTLLSSLPSPTTPTSDLSSLSPSSSSSSCSSSSLINEQTYQSTLNDIDHIINEATLFITETLTLFPFLSTSLIVPSTIKLKKRRPRKSSTTTTKPITTHLSKVNQANLTSTPISILNKLVTVKRIKEKPTSSNGNPKVKRRKKNSDLILPLPFPVSAPSVE